MNKVKNNLVVENARIGFRNFSGKEGKYNPPGHRNFCLFLDDPKVAERLIEEGWNVRHLDPRDPSEAPQPYMQVKVAFENFPPKIVLITGRGKSLLKESDVNILDWAEIKNVDLIIRPYNWEVRGDTGVTAYLKSAYITIEEDEFEDKYRDYPDSAENTVGGCGNCAVCDGHCKDELPF